MFALLEFFLMCMFVCVFQVKRKLEATDPKDLEYGALAASCQRQVASLGLTGEKCKRICTIYTGR